MGYINIYMANAANIYVKNNQLFLHNDEKTIDYPLEDINSIMIENLQTTISTHTLSCISQAGILTFICNQNHLPCGVILPFCEHYNTRLQYDLQINLSKPLQKQLWQSIIKNKISNQNEVLNIFGEYDVLKDLASSVLSGDSNNNEATASLIYFKKLFGKNFSRKDVDNPLNAFLNYGYSIIRGFVARSIVSHGLMPFLGIFHKSQLNQFNLADDFIEPFRPMVDMFVKIFLLDSKELTPTIKSQIYNIINYEVIVDNQKHSLSYAIELYIQSYVQSLKANKNLVKNIQFTGLKIHDYE